MISCASSKGERARARARVRVKRRATDVSPVPRRAIGLTALAAVAALAAMAASLGGCGSKAQSATLPSRRNVPAPKVAVGACAAVSDGVSSAHPQPVHADRDLNNDGAQEVVVADRALCDSAGNCHWNLFEGAPSAAGCQRYLGTFSGQALQVVANPPERPIGWVRMRAFWQLGGQRVLVQEYAMAADGYRLVDALLCRRDGAQLACTEAESRVAE